MNFEQLRRVGELEVKLKALTEEVESLKAKVAELESKKTLALPKKQ